MQKARKKQDTKLLETEVESEPDEQPSKPKSTKPKPKKKEPARAKKQEAEPSEVDAEEPSSKNTSVSIFAVKKSKKPPPPPPSENKEDEFSSTVEKQQGKSEKPLAKVKAKKGKLNIPPPKNDEDEYGKRVYDKEELQAIREKWMSRINPAFQKIPTRLEDADRKKIILKDPNEEEANEARKRFIFLNPNKAKEFDKKAKKKAQEEEEKKKPVKPPPEKPGWNF